MLNEIALVLLVTLVATALAILGVIELLWPAAPRRLSNGAAGAKTPTLTPSQASAPAQAPARPLASSRPPASAPPQPSARPSAPAPAPPSPGQAPRSARPGPPVETRPATPEPASPTAPPAPPSAGTQLDVVPPAPNPSETSTSAAPPTPRFPPPPPPESPAVASTAPKSAAPPTPSAAQKSPAVAPAPQAPSTARASGVRPPPAGDAAAASAPLPDLNLIDTCHDLFDARRFNDVIALAGPALEAKTNLPPADAAMLWSLVGRARWALRDGEGARAAFRSAIQIAPDDTRERYESQLRDIALTAAEDLVARSRDAVDAERLALLRSAHAWVRAAGPPDQSSEVRALVDRISMTYLPLCESAARAALAGGKFHEARELALDALEDARLPERRRAVIAELAGEAIEAEVSELAAGAVDNMEHGREAEALRALERGDELARNDILDGPRRDEIARRLWWAYTRLGVLRVEAEEFEQALDPLFRALRMDNVPPDNREETRWAMVRALDGLVKVRASSIREVVASGHNGAAIVQAERLWTLLRSGIAAGAPEEALLRARAISRELLEELGQRPQ